jgi:hypothetical protein
MENFELTDISIISIPELNDNTNTSIKSFPKIEDNTTNVNDNVNNGIKFKNVKTSFVGEKERLIYPSTEIKHNDAWGGLSIAITKHLKEKFTDEKTPQDTMRKLVDDIYDVCKDKLKTGYPPSYIKAKFKNRDKLISEVDNKKLQPRFSGNQIELIKHFNSLNTTTETQTITNVEEECYMMEDMDISDDEELPDNNEPEIMPSMLQSDNIQSKTSEKQPLVSINLEDRNKMARKKTKQKEIKRINKIRKQFSVKKTWAKIIYGKTNKFDNKPLTLDEFKNLLNCHKNANANYDGLSYEVVRRCEALQKKLLELYNKFIYKKKIPAYWYFGMVYDSYKGSGSTTDPKNFRSIIKIDTFSKLF